MSLYAELCRAYPGKINHSGRIEEVGDNKNWERFLKCHHINAVKNICWKCPDCNYSMSAETVIEGMKKELELRIKI